MTSGDSTPPNGWLSRAGWLVAGLALPTAVGTTLRRSVEEHPLTAALLLLAYWIGLAIMRFTGGVASALAERWRIRLVDRIDRASRRKLSRFKRHYAQYVIGSERYIDQKGLPTVGFYTPELDDVFVDVSLARRAPHQTSADLLGNLPSDVTERLSLGDFIDREQPVVLALTGAAGSGKTTLLRYTARNISRAHENHRRQTPILLYLRDHASAIVDAKDDEIQTLISASLGRYGPQPPGWFERQLREGNCVVLLDGLDEVAGDSDRRMVSRWVERQITQYPANDYVITSRPHGYRLSPIEGAIVLQTRPFTEEQVRKFIRAWYLAVERKSVNEDGVDTQMLASSGADDLLRRLEDAPSLYQLTANPLLLTMIANVHRFRGALPGSRADLYRDICEVMLWRRHEAKNLPVDMPGEHKEIVLRNLAFKMMQSKTSDLTGAEVISEISPTLSRMTADFSADRFLDLVSASGLLIERERGTYSFAHQTFQEYLAASHVRDKGLVQVLTQAVDDVWWRETTLLYVSRADADPIIRACLNSGTLSALTLAFDCAENKIELAPELRHRLNDFLAAAENEDAEPARRRLATGVLVSRLLRHVILVGNEGRLCRELVSNRIYNLFVDDMRRQGWNRAPDMTMRGTELPVIGVRGEDALAFVNWVNDLVAEPTYRLPNFQEADALKKDYRSISQSRSLWVHKRGGLPLRLNQSGDMEDVYSVKVEKLVDCLRRDLDGPDHPLLNLLFTRASVGVSLLTAFFQNDPGPELIGRAKILAEDVRYALDIPCDLTHDLNMGGSGILSHQCGLEPIREVALSAAQSLAAALDTVAAQRPKNQTGVRKWMSYERIREIIVNLETALARGREFIRAEMTYPELDPIATDVYPFRPRFVSDASLTRDFELHNSSLMGDSLTKILSQTMNPQTMSHWSRSERSEIAQTAFLGRLLAAAGIALKKQELKDRGFSVRDSEEYDPECYTYSPDSLDEHISANTLFRDDEVQRLSTWGGGYSEKLIASLVPVLERSKPFDYHLAGSLRLACVYLTAEERSCGGSSLGTKLIEILAGITVLETRFSGDNRPNEVIALALA